VNAAEPGDLIELGRRFRRLQSALDDVDILVASSFAAIDPALEASIARLRAPVRSAAELTAEFLETLEATPTFQEKRRQKLEER
jgi:hypothetical protein